MKKIRIGVLDFSSIENFRCEPSMRPKSSEITLLSNAIKKVGHIPVIYKVEKCQLFFDNKNANILYNNEKIKGCDVLLPRLDYSSNIDLEISIIRQFQLMGIPVLNRYLPISYAKNKLRTLQILTRMKVPVPKTIIVRKIEHLDEAIKKIGGYPVVIKAPFGSYGKQVALLESKRSLYSALDILWKQHATNIILIQEYIAEAQGSDYRAFVVGGKVVAAMKRTAKEGDFRSNLNLGGSASKVLLTPQEQKIAVRATKALELDICGVDLLRSKEGTLVMEMNANPGLSGIMKASGIDVAAKIVQYASKIALKS